MFDTRTLTIMATAASLVLIGAGCGAGQIAIPANEYNSESAITGVSDRIGTPPPVQQARPTPSPVAEAAPTPGAEISASAPTPSPSVPTSFPGVRASEELQGKTVRITTPKGEITFELLGDEGPKAASNFLALAESGFYDGLTFHRVVPGFVVQGGDPLGNGRGGPGYKFEDDPVSLEYDAGIVAMANSGPNTNGSQFFIMLEDNPSLPKLYSVFGRVTSGMDVVRRIEIGDVMTTVTVGSK